MKFASKIISLLMALVLIFTMATPVLASSVKNVKSVEQYADMLENEGYPAITTAEVIEKSLELTKAAESFVPFL